MKGFEAGGVDYVTKPVKQPEVYARVKTHLKVRALIEQQKAHLAALDRAKRELEVLNETKDKFLRGLADFDNYRKRVARERAQLTKCANEDLIKQLLDVVDNIERALSAATTT